MAVLLLGPPGSGKSDLCLRLLAREWSLVADDQVRLAVSPGGLLADAPAALAGMLEVRGLGVLAQLPHRAAALALAIDLVPRDAVPRLPHPAQFAALERTVPRLALYPFDASAPDKVAWALAAATARARLAAGAFAA